MADLPLTQPLVFQPIFMERIWGGRRLEILYGKRLPPGMRVGESWEIVDRPEAQSVVHDGIWRGRTLHELWTEERGAVFGDVPDAPRFPILTKLLDAQERLSLQVHPPAEIAKELGGEPKSEFWYIADAAAAAELYIGLKRGATRVQIEKATKQGNVEEHVHRIPVQSGDAIFLPSGRLHAIGAGNVIVEIQQNSDTTYRLSDWNRTEAGGGRRELHIAEALRCINYDDVEPTTAAAGQESLVRNELFEVEKWELKAGREVAPPGLFAIVGCVAGEIQCAGVTAKAGHFFLVAASMRDRKLTPLAKETVVLRATIGAR